MVFMQHLLGRRMPNVELEATSEDDIRAGDETLDAIFAEDHALDVGGGAASAGRTAAPPQGWGDLAVAQDYGIHLLPVVEVVAWDDVKAHLIMGLG